MSAVLPNLAAALHHDASDSESLAGSEDKLIAPTIRPLLRWNSGSSVSAIQRLPHWKLLIAAGLNSILAGFHTGYHTGVLNIPQSVLLQFVNASFYAHYNRVLPSYGLSALWSFVVSVFLIGGILGALTIGFMARQFGRRNALFLWVNLLQILASFCMAGAYFMHAFEVLIIGRFLAGIGCGLGGGLLAIYLTECSPDEFRGFICNFENFAITFCTLMATLISLPHALGSALRWPYLLGLGILPATLQILLTPLFPETPKYLYLERRNRQEALRAIFYYYGPDVHTEQILAEFERERSVGQLENSSLKATWGQRHYRIPILLGGLCAIASMSSGILAIFAYSADMFERAGVSRSMAVYATPIVSAFNLAGSIISLPLIDRVGRRPLLLYGLSVNVLCCAVFVLSAQLALRWPGAAWAALAAIAVHVCVFNIGPGPIVWFIGAEMTPQTVRPVAVSVSSVCNAAASLTMVQLYLVLEDSVGSYAFFLFIIPTSACIVVLHYWLPETKNRTIDEIVRAWMWRTAVDSDCNEFEGQIEDEPPQV